MCTHFPNIVLSDCVTCNAMLDGLCKVHIEPMVHISDSPILSYARASVPKGLELKTSLLNNTETGLCWNNIWYCS